MDVECFSFVEFCYKIFFVEEGVFKIVDVFYVEVKIFVEGYYVIGVYYKVFVVEFFFVDCFEV